MQNTISKTQLEIPNSVVMRVIDWESQNANRKIKIESLTWKFSVNLFLFEFTNEFPSDSTKIFETYKAQNFLLQNFSASKTPNIIKPKFHIGAVS